MKFSIDVKWTLSSLYDLLGQRAEDMEKIKIKATQGK